MLHRSSFLWSSDIMVTNKNFSFPYVKNRKDELTKSNKCFAHYTSAENALKILNNGELWLRNASLMNDTQELILGKELLLDYLRQKSIHKKLDKILKNLPVNIDLENILNTIAIDEFQTIKNNTYLSSLTEIKTTDNNGILSMWRGYAQNNGVALVFKRNILNIPNNIPVYFLPVLYTRKQRSSTSSFFRTLALLETYSDILRTETLTKYQNDYFKKYVEDNVNHLFPNIFKDKNTYIIEEIIRVIKHPPSTVCNIIQKNLSEHNWKIAKSFLQSVRKIKNYYDKHLLHDTIEHLIKNIFYLSIVSIKHAGFEEEAEWRILFDERKHTSSGSLSTEVECIKNTPQKVAKLSLNLSLKEDQKTSCLHKIIIGPCANPEIIREAFIKVLRDKGYAEPEKIIHISDIPLRT